MLKKLGFREYYIIFSLIIICLVYGIARCSAEKVTPSKDAAEVMATVQESTTLTTEEKEDISEFVGVGDGKEDVTSPLIMSSPSVTVKVGAKKVPGVLMCVDNVDKSVECNVVGDYDLDTVGKYKLQRVATDSKGNTTTYDFTLNVVESIPETTPTQPVKLNISDAIATYKNSTTKIGIDVSKWQGDIDWNKVAASGVEFVMIRLGTQDGFDGENTMDKYFIANYEGARAAGLQVGVYYHSYAKTLPQSVVQAFYVLQTLKDNGYTVDLPIAFDWETWKSFGTLGMSLNDLNNCAKIFLDVMDKSGYGGYLYSSKTYLENKVWNLPGYPVWLANYTNLKTTSYSGQHAMWQCSCTGVVPGISGDVDINVLYNS